MKKILIVVLCSLQWFLFSASAHAFVVQNIEIQGLERIEPATVYNYLPIKKGQHFDSSQTADIIHALYKTGFFEHITISREGNTLIIHVSERRTIGQLKLSGNSAIPTDKLKSVMRSLDVAEGRIYNAAVLERIKKSLISQYYQLGRYNASVKIFVSDMSRGRVLVRVEISEGLVAKIRRINIIGNRHFTDKTLIDQLIVTTPGLFTFFTQTDQYSQEKIDASLEGLKNFYLDHGFIKMEIKSSHVSITPDKKSVYITIAIEEGEQYTIKGYELAGEFIVPKEQLSSLVTFRNGEVFSRQSVLNSEKAITDVLGNKGYLYATVNIVPTIDDSNHQIFLKLVVTPGKRRYVRHIAFSDNTKTNDDVLRREVQQMEAAPVSTTNLEESKRRLGLLPYIKTVEMTVDPVPEVEDQVDVNYKITENNAAELSGRINYSPTEGFGIGGGVNQKNFLGTGKTLGFNAERTAATSLYSLNYSDPYFTADGISRSTSFSYTKFYPSKADQSNSYRSNEYDFSDVFSIPLSQEVGAINRLDLGYGYQNTLITLSPNPANVSNYVQNFINIHGRHFQQLDLITGISRDTRDRYIFPTRGAKQLLGLNFFLPADHNSLTYYILNYNGVLYQPITHGFIFMTRGAVAYGSSLNGGPSQYPFFKNFYAGGIDSVRGYAGNSLGPRDNTGNYQPTGGNLLVDASIGLIFPSYFSDNIRTSVFVDAGNVYQTFNASQFGGLPSGPIRYSAGVQAEWFSPMGPINLSLAKALNPHTYPAVPGVRDAISDDTEIFQFSIGANFG